MTSYTTPGFQWSLPELQEPQKKPSPATTKPIANPLLRQSFSPPTASLRLPFSPVENNGMRQRRQQESRLPSHATMPNNGKRPVRPPTASFLVNGDVGVSNDGAPLTQSTAEIVPQLVNNSLERWVVVYGYATSAQYESILRRFQSFGNVVSVRGSCRPGRSNWIALEYESMVQAEKALCQQNCLLMDGVLVGVTRLTLPLKQSLEWNPTSLSSLPDVASRLDDKFQTGVEMTEEDILLLASPEKQHQSFMVGAARRSLCERFLAWWFGWS